MIPSGVGLNVHTGTDLYDARKHVEAPNCGLGLDRDGGASYGSTQQLAACLLRQAHLDGHASPGTKAVSNLEKEEVHTRARATRTVF